MRNAFSIICLWGLVTLCIVSVPYAVNAQMPNSTSAIDSMVLNCQRNSGMQAYSDDNIFKVFPFQNKGTKKIDCEHDVSLLLETRSSGDTVFAKIFYSFRGELIYLKEQHIVYRQNEVVDAQQNKDFKVGYAASYYIINGSYADGKMSLSYEFRDYEYSPEPITYVMKMVKLNKEYMKR